MNIELSEDEIAMIDCWYNASAGECAHHGKGADWVLIKGLLAKFNIKTHHMDEEEIASV